jgi:hypothetical protein
MSAVGGLGGEAAAKGELYTGSDVQLCSEIVVGVNHRNCNFITIKFYER